MLAGNRFALGERAYAKREAHLSADDIWRKSYSKQPASVVLDIDDTLDVVRGPPEIGGMERSL